ncbi:MAG: hypothetical protein HZA01_07460 [Nitrospinae bacterium]|nr:hypothetical protein [Nitrospinota bacterium]
MKKKTVLFYVAGFCFMSLMWYYQYDNSMQYQRFIAVRVGGYLVEMQAALEKDQLPDEKLRKAVQKELQRLNIEVYGRQIDFLTGKMNPRESLEQFKILNAQALDVMKRDKIEEYFFYGKASQSAKMLVEPLCASEKPEEGKKGLAIAELSNLLAIESALALGHQNDADTLALHGLLKNGQDFKESCRKFLDKNPMHTLGRLQQGVDPTGN